MLYCSDGYTIGTNPSHIGGGYTIVDQNNNLIVTRELKRPNFTSNEAEFLGAFYAIQIANLGDTIILDSTVVETWVHKGFSKARPDLNEDIFEASILAMKKNLSVIQKPREQNLAGIYNEFTLKV